MPARSAPRTASTWPTASACSTPARRLAARPAHILERAQVAAHGARRRCRRAARAFERNLERLGLRARDDACADCTRARRLVGRRAVRSHPRRRALLRFRASRAAIRTSSGCGARSDVAGFAARQARDPRCALAGARRRVVNCCMSPAPCFRRRTTQWSRLSSRARRARAALPLPDGGRGAAAAGRRARRLLLRADPQDKPEATRDAPHRLPVAVLLLLAALAASARAPTTSKCATPACAASRRAWCSTRTSRSSSRRASPKWSPTACRFISASSSS